VVLTLVAEPSNRLPLIHVPEVSSFTSTFSAVIPPNVLPTIGWPREVRRPPVIFFQLLARCPRVDALAVLRLSRPVSWM